MSSRGRTIDNQLTVRSSVAVDGANVTSTGDRSSIQELPTDHDDLLLAALSEPRKRAAKRAERRRKWIIWAVRIAFVGLMVASWEYCSRHEIVDPLFAGKPSGIAREFWNQLDSDVVTVHLPYTVTEVLIGWTIGCALGFVAGLLMAQSDVVLRALRPLITALNCLPRISLAPLFVAWFGLGMTPRVVLAITIVFFVLVTNTLAGYMQADRDIVLLTQSLGATRRQMVLKAILPAALPVVFAGLQLSVVYSFLGVIAAEIMAGNNGLGSAMTRYVNLFDADKFFAVLILLVITATLMSTCVLFVERRLLRWHDIEARRR